MEKTRTNVSVHPSFWEKTVEVRRQPFDSQYVSQIYCPQHFLCASSLDFKRYPARLLYPIHYGVAAVLFGGGGEGDYTEHNFPLVDRWVAERLGKVFISAIWSLQLLQPRAPAILFIKILKYITVVQLTLAIHFNSQFTFLRLPRFGPLLLQTLPKWRHVQEYGRWDVFMPVHSVIQWNRLRRQDSMLKITDI